MESPECRIRGRPGLGVVPGVLDLSVETDRRVPCLVPHTPQVAIEKCQRLGLDDPFVVEEGGLFSGEFEMLARGFIDGREVCPRSDEKAMVAANRGVTTFPQFPESVELLVMVIPPQRQAGLAPRPLSASRFW